MLRALIHLYKYGKVRTLSAPLGDFLTAALPRDEAFDLIAPVPLHWLRQWQRGFNQSDLLARALAKHCGLPVWRALQRVRGTASQAGLSHTGRRKNVNAAFACRRDLNGKSVLLIDDVLTTGATAAACASALKRAGARHVAVLTVARVDRRMTNSTSEGVS